MADKPWFNNSFLDRRNSTVQTYPPKDKKVFWADGFLEAEHFGNSVFQPLADGLTLGNNPCDGRVLQPAQQVTWPTGGNKPSEGEVKEYQAEVTGAVGETTFSMDPFWDVVNEEGDKATIDPSTGLITIDSGGCQGAWPPWIIYWVCDDCGCSQGTVWLEDSSEDCDACGDADCDLPELTGADSIGLSDTSQYSLNDAQGTVEWSVSGGSGVSISDTGLVTTDGAACGTATVSATDSCCGGFTKSVKLGDATTSHWGSATEICTTSCASGFGPYGGVFEDDVYRYATFAYVVGCGPSIVYEADCSGEASCPNINLHPFTNPCSGGNKQEIHIYQLNQQEWECIA